MRIVKCEKIYLSEREQEIFTWFTNILDAIDRESENPNVKEIIDEIQDGVFDLANYIDEECFDEEVS